MDLFPAIATAIQKLQGIECNEHLQTVNALKMMPTLLQYGPIENINNFLMFYQTHHSLDDVPNPTIRTMDDEYQMVEEWTNAMHLHTISLQRTENKGIQLYTKCLESILTTPTASYNKQVEENQRLLNLKKLSNEIILGKSTEDTAIELDGEGAANYEQLKDLIRKECDKQDRKYARLEDKYNKLEQQVTHKDHQKNMQQAKDSYESALKNVIEECIALEIQAAKKEELQLIMDLFPAIGTAIQKLQGIECNEHLQTVNALKMMPTLLQYGPIENINNFLMFYQTHHSLDNIPNPITGFYPKFKNLSVLVLM